MKLISQPESFDSTSYPSFPFPLMLSNPPAILHFLSRPLPLARSFALVETLAPPPIVSFVPFIFLPRRTTSITLILPDRPPPSRRYFIFTVPTNGRGPRPIADGNALEEIHVACKKNYDSSAFPSNSRLLNEGERCREISRLLHGFSRT